MTGYWCHSWSHSCRNTRHPSSRDPRFPSTLHSLSLLQRGHQCPFCLTDGERTTRNGQAPNQSRQVTGPALCWGSQWEPPNSFPSRGQLLSAAPEAGAGLCCWDYPWGLGHLHTHNPTAQDTVLVPSRRRHSPRGDITSFCCPTQHK